MKKRNLKLNKGAAMITLLLFFVFISIIVIAGTVNPIIREYRIASETFLSKQTYYLSESGVEDLVYRMKNKKQYNNYEVLSINKTNIITTITDIGGSEKEIISTGDTNGIQRKVAVKVTTGVGASFSYGVLTGAGGFTMANGSKIVGSVYSNGSISGSGEITGSATSADTSPLESDQSNGTGVPVYNLIFGRYLEAEDISQSFISNKTEKINKISLYLRKISTPSNINILITSDNNNSPSSNIIATGSISSSLVSTNYGWVEAVLNSSSSLVSGTKYWIIIDVANSSTKYYNIGANNDGYLNGISKLGKYNTSWVNNTPQSADIYFNIYSGGYKGSINGIKVGTAGVGNTYANSVTNSIIEGINYCKIGSGNNKTCNTGRENPIQASMPFSEQNIIDWKNEALAGGTINGDFIVTENTSIGPKKITGNLITQIGKTLTINGPLWIEGNLVMSNNSIAKLAPRYGTNEESIIIDGTVDISNNATFQDSGTPGSYVLVLTTSNSTSALNLANNAGAVALYAANGTINVSNNGTAKSLTGYNVNLNNNAVITYDSGMADLNFVSGPSGTWKINSWKEKE